ncbi:MAG: hypothetical protein GVY19_10365 [Bacteroidetes bacterium]|jgi:hypothetical protein|nr:hypothetical protein [Bacteroidota bacterium]
MKIIVNIILAALLFVCSPALTQAQSKIDTTTFHVDGVCNTCKERIERAALLRGVKYVEWEKTSEQLTVVYRNDKVKPDDVHISIASIGHDTEKVKASDEAYSKLPDCCLYRSDIKKH